MAKVKLKKLIAREWLMFLLFFLLSPAVLGTYSWISTPKKYDERAIPAYGYPRIYDPILTKRKALTKETNIPPGFVRLRESKVLKEAITKFKAGRFLAKNEEVELRSAEKRGLLIYKKRPFWDYLTATITDLDKYLAVLFIYPLFLLIRSIIWAIRTMSRRES